MARRRRLQGVVAAIIGKFVSRNNDIGGYWALGILYKAASLNLTNTVHLDLLDQQILISLEKPYTVIIPFRKFLEQQLLKQGLELKHIKIAEIDIVFNSTEARNLIDPIFNPSLDCRSQEIPLCVPGDAYLCRARIVDDFGKEYNTQVYGWCRKHDPYYENKSTRVEHASR